MVTPLRPASRGTCGEGARERSDSTRQSAVRWQAIAVHPAAEHRNLDKASSMTLTTFSLILVGVLLNAGAQLLLKAGTNAIGVLGLDGARAFGATALAVATQPYVVGGLASYVVSVAIWIVALSRVEVSVAYPMLSIGYVVNALAAWYLFGEALTATRVAGIFVIIVGVVLVARS